MKKITSKFKKNKIKIGITGRTLDWFVVLCQQQKDKSATKKPFWVGERVESHCCNLKCVIN